MARVAVQVHSIDRAFTQRAAGHQHERQGLLAQHPHLAMRLTPRQCRCRHIAQAHFQARPLQTAQASMPRHQIDGIASLHRHHSSINDCAVYQPRLAQGARHCLLDGIDTVVGKHIDRIPPEAARIQRTCHHRQRQRGCPLHATVMRLDQGVARLADDDIARARAAIQSPTGTRRCHHAVQAAHRTDDSTLGIGQRQRLQRGAKSEFCSLPADGCRSNKMPWRGCQLVGDGVGTAARQPHLQDVLSGGCGARQATVVERACCREQLSLVGGKHVNSGHQRQPLGSDALLHSDVQAITLLRQCGLLGAREAVAVGNHLGNDAVGIGQRDIAHTHRFTHPQVGPIMQTHRPAHQHRCGVQPLGSGIVSEGTPRRAQHRRQGIAVGIGQRCVPLAVRFYKGIRGDVGMGCDRIDAYRQARHGSGTVQHRPLALMLS